MIIPAAIALVIAAGSEGVLAQTIDAAAQQGIYDGLYDFYYYHVPFEYTQLITRAYGVLNSGQSGSMQSGLLAGTQYMIGAQCEPADCQDIYLHIYDPSGALVIEDATGTNLAFVSFQAEQSGNYTLGVTVANCSADPCYFGVDIFSKYTPGA
jgi:hypothetical protein